MDDNLVKYVIRATVPREIRNWIRSPSRSFRWLWDSLQFSLGAKKSVRLSPDWSPICHPIAYRALSEAQIGYPDHAQEFLSFLSHCSNKMFLFDIGAHFGTFSLTTAHFGGTAIAVDASSIATRMIAKQAALNGLTDKIRIIQAAVSHAGGTLEVLTSGAFSLGFCKVDSGGPKRGQTRIKAITIDQMVSQFGAPTHIKIDVEGYESSVLRGGRETLSQHGPLLFLELHNELVKLDGGDPVWALEELERLGYSAQSFDGRTLSRSEMLSRPIMHIIAAHAGSS